MIGIVRRVRETAQGESHETVFFITSLPARVQRIAKHLRGHWGVENSLHWSLDVTFGEDRSRIRLGNGPEIAAVFRRLALTVLKQDTTVKKSSIRGKRLQAGWNNDVLQAILTGIHESYDAIALPVQLNGESHRFNPYDNRHGGSRPARREELPA